MVVTVRGTKDGLIHLALLAITTQPPHADRVALEVSAIECRRAGLTDLNRCWVVVDEYDYDIAERSWCIEPDGKILGRFSKAFMMKIAGAFIDARSYGRRVSRLD
ncbi:hypothetical protein MesoLjLc_29500 [Mesorhizobium sp. L-8-10]|nr:hypothetical protein MesoLjLc_29500 [Mesorhizobium sp. L-8-10]